MTLQVISAHSLPDRAELNYHAGTATRSAARSVIVVHSGIQFSDEQADMLTAMFLLITCTIGDCKLSGIRLTLNCLASEIMQFMTTGRATLKSMEVVGGDFCKTKIERVTLICLCLVPWIEGNTSAAMYEDKQNLYNVYNCSKCDNWYHKYCLKYCNIKPPKRNAHFVCPECETPSTVAWHHENFINTCTADNFLTILLLYCRQNEKFIDTCLGCSEAEDTLKASIRLMLQGKINEGKRVILSFVSSCINLPLLGQQYNFHGTEYNMFLCLFSHVWKIIIRQRCISPHCPGNNQEVVRHSAAFTFTTMEYHLRSRYK